MGRWGEPPAKAARERTIAVRMKQPPKTFQTTPENVGKENSLYPAWLEKFWHVYEGDFIRAAGDLDAGALQQGDETYLLLHVSALKPRKTSLLDDLNEHQASSNLPLFTETGLPRGGPQASARPSTACPRRGTRPGAPASPQRGDRRAGTPRDRGRDHRQRGPAPRHLR